MSGGASSATLSSERHVRRLPLRLELRGITKRFPGVVANDAVDLTVESGEILGLLGENGAGKTTLMNILYGLYSADEGHVLIDGEEVHFDGPGDAIAAGIGMVHQHFMLVPVFTVTENVVLGNEPTDALGRIDVQEARREVAEISSRYGLEVDPTAIIEGLPVGLQQRVEIIKVLFREAEIIVFDEPTSVLTPQEVEEFFEIARGLKEAGKGIVFITHKLGEMLEIADRISVLRRGKIVGEAKPDEVTPEQLAEMMVGRPVDLVVDKTAAEPGDPVLEVSDLVVTDARGHRAVDGVSFTVRAGEIVGIAGVQGNGQTELVEAITGLVVPLAGHIVLDGRDITRATPRERHRLGMSHVPEDRQRDGLVLDFDLTENIVLNAYYDRPYSRGIVMDWDAAREHAEELVTQYDVRTPSVDVLASHLSGGNQQKLIVAREFARDTALIVASQPTRGVDVGSIEYIHRRIVEERDEGSAVLIVSSELDEILALSDRILVMYRGRIVAETTPAETTPAELGLYMAGQVA
ncbi:MAG TPA: ABC transporter ATP-binding protein [Acidimicrobiia bacterium]|nr:ABC transporter ATP-binding protein [Acidimicrobiia bacterium]